MPSSDILAPPQKDNDHQDNHDASNNNTNSRKALASQWAGSLLQTTKQTVQSWTVRKYNLPDKHVASQVLMYRQLLHTSCRPNLTLSRDYQGTPAQKAVLHMPWWSHGILETRKMVISYQNLVARLWVAGACVPYGEAWQQYETTNTTTTTATTTSATADLLNDHHPAPTESTNETPSEISATNNNQPFEEKKEAEGSTTAEQAKFRAPVPHKHWVDRLGFQQEDPVTDFRSGGVLSLAMMVHLVESCPKTHGRFILEGDAAVLPFGLTCINVTDMMAKFLMLSKTVDRMDALLSQKPFWRMFEDPMAMCVCQEMAMQLTADVAIELQQERGSPVTVFDFATIMGIVEKRFEYDYLMAGPTSSSDLRKIHVKNKQKYRLQLQHRMQMAKAKEEKASAKSGVGATSTTTNDESTSSSAQQFTTTAAAPRLAAVQQTAVAWKDKASSVAGNVWSKVKSVPVADLVSRSKTNTTSSATHQGLAQDEPVAPTPDFLQPEEDGFVNENTNDATSPPPPASYAAGDEVDDAEDVDL